MYAWSQYCQVCQLYFAQGDPVGLRDRNTRKCARYILPQGRHVDLSGLNTDKYAY